MAYWIEKCNDIVCPFCGAEFDDEIYFMPRRAWHKPYYCPDCGEAVATREEDVDDGD